MTEQELMAAIAARRRVPTTLNSPGAIDPNFDPNAPPPQFANSAQVNAAYQAMMGYNAQADQDTGTLRRRLTDTLDLSGKARLQSILNSHQGFADRGTLNSGVALNKDTQVNTNFDTTDAGYNNSFEDNLRAIARHKLDLSQNYQNSQLVAGEQATAAKAAADAQALTAQTAQQNQTDLLAQLQAISIPTAIPDQAPQVMAAPVQHVFVPTKPPPKPKVPVIKSPIPKLTLKGLQ